MFDWTRVGTSPERFLVSWGERSVALTGSDWPRLEEEVYGLASFGSIKDFLFSSTFSWRYFSILPIISEFLSLPWVLAFLSFFSLD